MIWFRYYPPLLSILSFLVLCPCEEVFKTLINWPLNLQTKSKPFRRYINAFAWLLIIQILNEIPPPTDTIPANHDGSSANHCLVNQIVLNCYWKITHSLKFLIMDGRWQYWKKGEEKLRNWLYYSQETVYISGRLVGWLVFMACWILMSNLRPKTVSFFFKSLPHIFV